MAKVQILGTGCSKCGYLLKKAQAAANAQESRLGATNARWISFVEGDSSGMDFMAGVGES
jgi:hypothetical protein